jgi:hypothetical protein
MLFGRACTTGLTQILTHSSIHFNPIDSFSRFGAHITIGENIDTHNTLPTIIKHLLRIALHVSFENIKK